MKYILSLCAILFVTCTQAQPKGQLPSLRVSPNGRFLMTADGHPFFWLGDTGWLLLSKLKRNEVSYYFNIRHQEGFNVIQVMLLPKLSATDAFGDSALIDQNIARPATTRGRYGYWNNLDAVVDKAAAEGIYLALVPVWGSIIKSGKVSREQAKAYASFLAHRYRNKTNIIWMNGGDIKGSDSTDIWNMIGNTLHAADPNALITFHPRGRTQSSTWFQQAPWLSFNTFQSGHRRYDQDTSAGDLHYGEDNWRYVESDYNKLPVKPTLDAEPSYEQIPQGLHDTSQPRWQAADVRRYAYWSVFAGAAGFTYGHNAVIQFHRPGDKNSAYGAREYWKDALQAPGARQMIFLKNLMLSHPYFNRVPDSDLVVNNGNRYDHLAATVGTGYAFIYTYTGRPVKVRMQQLFGNIIKASWYNPRNGQSIQIGNYLRKGIREFDPPGKPAPGNDWVLILETPIKQVSPD